MGNLVSKRSEKQKCLIEFRDILRSRGLIARIKCIGDVKILRIRLKMNNLYAEVLYSEASYSSSGYVIMLNGESTSLKRMRVYTTIEKDANTMLSLVNFTIVKNMNMNNIHTQYLLFEDRRQRKINEYLDNRFPKSVRKLIKKELEDKKNTSVEPSSYNPAPLHWIRR